MASKEYITLDLSEIKPYPNNPRINADAVNDVIASIQQCHYIDPIEIDENNVILSGHTRYKALKRLKYKQCDVIRVRGLTEEEKRKYRLLTNKTGESALWDSEKLEIELDGLDFGGYDFNFDVNLDEDFSIDDIDEVDGYDAENGDNEFFTATLTFPAAKKKQITNYLKTNKERITNEIIAMSEK